MSRLQWLIREIHRRSLWQVALTYLGVSWVVLQVAGEVIDRFQLADWAYGSVVLVLLVGLPVVIATAIVQEGPPGSAAAAAHGKEHAQDSELFRWRNAIFGGIAAGLLVVVAVSGWYAFTRWGDGVDDRGATTAVAAPAGREPDAGEPAPQTAEDERLADLGEPEGQMAVGGREDETTGIAVGPDTGTADAPEPSSASRRGGGERTSEPASDRSAYRTALRETDSARTRAVSVDAAARAPDRWRAADSLYRAALATAAEGSYPAAERELVLARLGYEDARALALRAERARDSIQTAIRDAAAEDRDEPADEADEEDGPAEEGPADAGAPDAMGVVDTVLAALKDAIEAEDPDALRRVWVTASVEQMENFDSFFRDARDLEVHYDVDEASLRASEDRIEVETRTTWRFRDGDGRSRIQGPFRQRFVFERRAGAWVVTSY